MRRIFAVALASALVLSGCVYGPRPAPLGPGGTPLPGPYRINPVVAAQIPGSVLGQINLLRANSALPPLALNPQLSAAAAAHARDMAAQNRAWHFGSDGSSPLDRVKRQSYTGTLVGENISETFENEIATLGAWMQERDTRDIIMDPAARSLGIGWFQEPGGKVWWALLTGS